MATAADPRNTPEWERVKERAKKRDQYRCQHCGVHEAYYRKVDLHVHHILPVKDGGGNGLENLITLCKTCHDQVHEHAPNDVKRLTPDLIEDDRATWGYPESRRDFSELKDVEQQIVGVLKENGPTKLEHIDERIDDHSYSVIQKALESLQIGKRIGRVSRGVYAYITKLRYGELQATEPDENGRRWVTFWDPGEQVQLNRYTQENPNDE